MSDISGNSRSPADRIKWIVILILVIAVGALVLILLREDPRQFTIRIPTSPGESIEVSFEGRSANIIDILDCIPKGRDPPPEEETGSSMKEATYRGCDKSSNFDPKIAKLALAEHGYYRVPSPEAGMAIRDLPEAESQFAEIVRSALYNLEGPFTIPYTFRKADAKLLDALADLYREEPSHPLIVTLWEWSLNLENVFFLQKSRSLCDQTNQNRKERPLPAPRSCRASTLSWECYIQKMHPKARGCSFSKKSTLMTISPYGVGKT